MNSLRVACLQAQLSNALYSVVLLVGLLYKLLCSLARTLLLMMAAIVDCSARDCASNF